MNQVPTKEPTNIRRYRKKFNRHGNLAPGFLQPWTAIRVILSVLVTVGNKDHIYIVNFFLTDPYTGISTLSVLLFIGTFTLRSLLGLTWLEHQQFERN